MLSQVKWLLGSKAINILHAMPLLLKTSTLCALCDSFVLSFNILRDKKWSCFFFRKYPVTGQTCFMCSNFRKQVPFCNLFSLEWNLMVKSVIVRVLDMHGLHPRSVELLLRFALWILTSKCIFLNFSYRCIGSVPGCFMRPMLTVVQCFMRSRKTFMMVFLFLAENCEVLKLTPELSLF